MSSTAQLKHTALHAEHVAAGARMVPFAGYEMPVNYPSGILREHDAVRTRAGLFDLSHMAQYTVGGAGAAALLDRLTVNTVAALQPGRAQYNLFCNDAGGTHDDVIVYRLPEQYLVVANGANAQKIWDLLAAAAAHEDVELTDLRDKRALLALQGPLAVEILHAHTAHNVAQIASYGFVETKVFGHAALVARTGYTGEDGFELYVGADVATELWRALLAAGAAAGLLAAGLGARDLLRTEAALPLYGHELSETISPLQARLGWAVKTDKGEFTGRAALVAERARGDRPVLTGLLLEGRAPAREGYPVFSGERRIGTVTSGTFAPALGGRTIALALIEPAHSVVGQTCAIEIRGNRAAANVVKLPFYKRKRNE